MQHNLSYIKSMKTCAWVSRDMYKNTQNIIVDNGKILEATQMCHGRMDKCMVCSRIRLYKSWKWMNWSYKYPQGNAKNNGTITHMQTHTNAVSPHYSWITSL